MQARNVPDLWNVKVTRSLPCATVAAEIRGPDPASNSLNAILPARPPPRTADRRRIFYRERLGWRGRVSEDGCGKDRKATEDSGRGLECGCSSPEADPHALGGPQRESSDALRCGHVCISLDWRRLIRP